MKRLLYGLAACCLILVTFNSCDGLFGPKEFEEDLLIGKWQNDGNLGEYWVYSTETTADGNYQYGHTWDENDDVHEEDLTKYGNGWFKWQLVKTDLTQIHLMENGGAEVPKVYTVTVLTSSKLTYKEDLTKKTISFTKVQ